MSMDRHTLQAVLEEQERHRDGVERRREERDAQRDAERTAHLTAMADKMAAMCLAIQNLVVAQAQEVPGQAAILAQGRTMRPSGPIIAISCAVLVDWLTWGSVLIAGVGLGSI
ncbi:UNVERIFIED_CONTAM: hypothetical protein FKN15_045474 [Acipenser sinensis]